MVKDVFSNNTYLFCWPVSEAIQFCKKVVFLDGLFVISQQGTGFHYCPLIASVLIWMR